MIKIESDRIIFSTGKVLGFNCEVVGLRVGSTTIFGGYDDSYDADELTDEEWFELAMFMSEAWRKAAVRPRGVRK